MAGTQLTGKRLKLPVSRKAIPPGGRADEIFIKAQSRRSDTALPEGGPRIAQAGVCRMADDVLGNRMQPTGRPVGPPESRCQSACQRARVQFPDAPVRADDKGQRQRIPIAVGIGRFVHH